VFGGLLTPPPGAHWPHYAIFRSIRGGGLGIWLLRWGYHKYFFNVVFLGAFGGIPGEPVHRMGPGGSDVVVAPLANETCLGGSTGDPDVLTL